MQTIISDDPAWIAGYPPVPGIPQLTVREKLAKGFDPEADFYLFEGCPHVVWGNWDYAEYWGPGGVREVHPFAPCLQGTKIPEIEFRKLVLIMHGIPD